MSHRGGREFESRRSRTNLILFSMGNYINTSPETLKPKYTRREFLGMSALAGTGGIVCVCAETSMIGLMARYFLPEKPDGKSSDDLEFSDEIYQYNSEVKRIVEQVKSEFGVKIVSPKTWAIPGKEQLNLPWGLKEIALVAQALSQLPPAYFENNRSPREILLLRVFGSAADGGVGGGYIQRRMLLYTSEKFQPETKLDNPTLRSLYLTQGDELRNAVIHEWTHSFTEANPDVLDDFAKQAGWIRQVDGSWKNINPKNLFHHADADILPREDIAVSAGLMLVNPGVLSSDRRNFFLNRPEYSTWSSVTKLKK